ncbi:MAG: AmmeMemoRadiSam system radical SAM enzyme [Candidatus Lindowbacteria bacterium RIFCSPLOWO2_12_FULL_62_27]|nr:MAG: AmmeMemoRadiSam system radical SAM enzyme [Candidatus Lindowbacteria bacterium RIFCSPLOWO2_12_FULL_62_27]OGH63918.1 MAG: AmmeMemoRadiSam system radical SAM enzyme [Candidatus Lindowbacteria bacterium RIFCSPLOWO2_02_FULL_62_12]
MLVEKMEDHKVRCVSCGHRCLIGDGKRGICKVRYNEGGVLYVPRGYVGALQCDPIEKKPFFHAMPGTQALSFGMLGCDFHCSYCQNWFTSQSLRDENSTAPPRDVSAEDLVHLARRERASTVASTYNEPLITSEWAVEVFKQAKSAGFKTAYISNGNGTPEVLEYIRPWVDLYKVDLKGFTEKGYHALGGQLSVVLDTIGRLHRMGFWVEIVTLVVPGFNDSEAELRDIARFLAGVSKDIPWHVTAFHQDYKMIDRRDTTERDILRAAEIGKEEGLHYVYAGNRPGRVGEWENTVCPKCETPVIERIGFRIVRNLLKGGACPKCLTAIPGVWS